MIYILATTRTGHEFATADRIRAEIEAAGFVVNDGKAAP